MMRKSLFIAMLEVETAIISRLYIFSSLSFMLLKMKYDYLIFCCKCNSLLILSKQIHRHVPYQLFRHYKHILPIAEN